MKMHLKRKIILIIAVFLIMGLLLLPACASNRHDGDIPGDGNNGYITDEDAESSNTPQIVLSQSNRKIIYTINMSMTVKKDKYNNTIDKIYDIIFDNEEDKNWISKDSESTHGNNLNRSLTIRVKTEKLNDFLSQIGELGTIGYYRLGSEDITANYANAEARKSALEESRSYYQGLLDSLDLEALTPAEYYQLISEVQEKIIEINNKLFYINDELTKYDDVINYSYINLTISQGTSSSSSSVGFGTRLKDASLNSIRFVWEALKWILVALIYIIPSAIIIGGIVVAGFFIHKFIKEQKESRKSKKQEEKKDDNQK